MKQARVVGVTMVRDEADVIYETLMHLGEEGLVALIVIDNGSVDETADEIERARRDLAGQCEVISRYEGEIAYYQSRIMSLLAAEATTRLGAEWIVPFDADELWLGEDRLSVVLGRQPDNANVVMAVLY